MIQMKKNKKILLIFIIILIIVLGIVALIYFNSLKNQTEEPIKVLDVIDDFHYKLKENDSKLKKDLFYELKDILDKDEVNYQSYAEVLAKIFVVDVFSLDTKLNKYDIGGLDFILESEKENYQNILSDTLYDIVENNYDGKRNQELPLVKNIEVTESTEGKFGFDNKEILSYDIVLTWTYEKDLGYDTTALVKVGKVDEFMYIVSYSPNK